MRRGSTRERGSRGVPARPRAPDSRPPRGLARRPPGRARRPAAAICPRLLATRARACRFFGSHRGCRVGRPSSGWCPGHAADLRVPSPRCPRAHAGQGGGIGRHQHGAGWLSPRGRCRDDRRPALRGTGGHRSFVGRDRPGVGRRAAEDGARVVARGRAVRPGVDGRVRGAGGCSSGRATRSGHRTLGRGGDGARSRRTRHPRRPRREVPAARAPRRRPDARALPGRTTGGRADRIPDAAADPRRRARDPAVGRGGVPSPARAPAGPGPGPCPPGGSGRDSSDLPGTRTGRGGRRQPIPVAVASRTQPSRLGGGHSHRARGGRGPGGHDLPHATRSHSACRPTASGRSTPTG